MLRTCNLVNAVKPDETDKRSHREDFSGSTIINTASVNSFNPVEELLTMRRPKVRSRSFTTGLAKQLASKGIRVNAVAPGPVWIPSSGFGRDTPMGRAGQPVKLGRLYVTLAEEKNSFTTGSVLGANGGTGVI